MTIKIAPLHTIKHSMRTLFC